MYFKNNFMETETKQPHGKASLQRGRPHTSSLRGKQILERRKEIHPVRYSERSNGVKQELVDMLKETDPPSLKLRTGRERFYFGSCPRRYFPRRG